MRAIGLKVTSSEPAGVEVTTVFSVSPPTSTVFGLFLLPPIDTLSSSLKIQPVNFPAAFSVRLL